MSDFTDLQALLAQQRAARADAARQLEETRERLKHVGRELDALSRSADPDDQAGVQRRGALEAESAALEGALDGARGSLAERDSQNLKLLADLTLLADPAEQVEELRDAFPILFFPLRIETRFKTLDTAAGQKQQLWVRAYPDDCQVDAFEEMLSDAEVKSAQSYWVEVWKAGGIDEAQERGAWKSFVGSHGSGRAAWIVKQYAPLNLNAKPAKAKPEDVILVVPQVELEQEAEEAACEFWVAFWQADGDAAREQDALQALKQKVQDDAVVADILEKFRPLNLADDPPGQRTRDSVKAACAKILFDPSQPAVTKTTSWTRAPKARAMPDRLVLMCFDYDKKEVKHVVGKPIPDNLAVGPDPTLPENEQLRMENGELVVNDELRWTVDFERAVEVGMGFKVDLTAAEAADGFWRLFVLGVRISADEAEGQELLQDLILRHHHSRRGISLVPQGSPTNNTEGEGSAYTWVDDADASFDTLFKGVEAFTATQDLFARSDGEWLARHLGIEADLLKQLPRANGRDQAEARAMNTALWPATLGYMLEEMMRPVFTDADITATRSFFNTYVSGRGPVPAVRVGRQPYGILPAMAFARYQPSPSHAPGATLPPGSPFGGGTTPAAVSGDYLKRLHALLMKIEVDWVGLSQGVAHVGADGDPHQTLLDIIGLHSGSVEFHQRYAESLQHIFNELMMQTWPDTAVFIAEWLRTRGAALLEYFGYVNLRAEVPILEKFFFGEGNLLTGHLVDDVPLSESEPVRAYTADKKNYIEWLATSSTDAIRMQNFGGQPAPTALLYLMLRHAALLGQWDAAVRMLTRYAKLDATAARREPDFLHVQAATASEGVSKFEHLYHTEPLVTGDATTTIAEHILKPAILGKEPETHLLNEIVEALKSLVGTPTARLERVFAEHVDCCSYRLDAWKTGIVATRLEEIRRLPTNTAPPGGAPTKGLYLGAYGWLEHVKSEKKVLSPVGALPPGLQEIFQPAGQPPLVIDSSNAGYIHAPSLSHAATAAVLKNAYTVNATPQNPETMSVNLSSERVRRALGLLEGLRNGQSLSALLGYHFERGLHDRHEFAEVDKFVYPIRQAFPLVADKLKETKSDGAADIRLMEARNVVDGVRLINHIRETKVKTYPFGLPTVANKITLPQADANQRAAINAEVDAILDLNDAVADLLLAENVHQTVLGNFDRAAASAQTLGRGKYPPEPEVAITPRSGISLTHRVALHLDASADPNTSPSAVPMTPRARAEAPLNKWLAERLPAPADVVCQVAYTSPAFAGEKTAVVSQQALGLQPADLLYLGGLDLEQAMAELDGRVVQYLRYEPTLDPHPALAVHIRYTESVAGRVTFFELAPLIRSLRTLLLKSRHVSPADMTLPDEAEAGEYVYDFAELEGRINTAAGELNDRLTPLTTLEADASDLDDYARKVTDVFLAVALHGMPQTGVGDVHDSIRAIYAAVLDKVGALVTRWQQKGSEFDDLLTNVYPTLTTDAERLALLARAEGLIAADTTDPTPAVPATYKASVESLKQVFDGRLGDFQSLLVMNTGKLVDFLAAVEAAAAAAPAHDIVPFDIADQQKATASLRAELAARVKSLREDLSARLARAGELLAEAAGVTDLEGRARALLQAAAHVLGDETKLLPRFKLPAAQGLELQNCVSNSAALLTYLKTARGRRFPEDDWLYGLARVREKLRAWENVLFLGEAFGTPAPALTPLQLPHRANDSWLALEFPDKYKFDRDRLLYTAHFAAAFDKDAAQCGLLLDDWTEVIPGREEVTGVTFHFDRPNSEPPQVMLLAVPPKLTGRWHWGDLVAMLHETLDGARTRAVEPRHVDDSNYGQFLPAALMAVTLYQINIATNLGINNGIYQKIG